MERENKSEAEAALRLFVRCGERFEAPDPGWQVLSLPHPLAAEHLPEAVRRVRGALSGVKEAELLLAGPVVLGVALGQALAHIPARVVYLQLNQATKTLEPWARNDLDW